MGTTTLRHHHMHREMTLQEPVRALSHGPLLYLSMDPASSTWPGQTWENSGKWQWDSSCVACQGRSQWSGRNGFELCIPARPNGAW